MQILNSKAFQCILAIAIVIILTATFAPAHAEDEKVYLETSGYVEMDKELIMELQQALNDKLGFIKRHSSDYYINIEELKPLKVDGKLGPETLTRLKLFQHAASIPVDGNCGPRTWKKLGKNYTDCLYNAPDLFEEFEKSTSGYGFIQTLDTNLFYVFKSDEAGWLLTAKWKSATGNQKKGWITPSGTFILSNKARRNHSSIGEENSWKADNATGFFQSDGLGYFFIHATVDYWEKVDGVYQWVPEKPKKVLGRSVTHGCIRLAPENAKWVTKHRNGTVLVILDKDPFK